MPETAVNQEPKKYLLTPAFRISYPYLFVPRPPKRPNDKEAYTIMMLFSKQTDINEILQLVVDALPSGYTTANLPPNFGWPIKDGNTRINGKTGILSVETNPEMKDHWVIDAKTNWIAPVLDENLIPIDKKDSSKVYPGCYCRAQLCAAYYNNEAQGVGLYFTMVQKIGEGKPLGSKPDPFKVFGIQTTEHDQAIIQQGMPHQAEVAQTYTPPVTQATQVAQPPVGVAQPPAGTVVGATPPATPPPVPVGTPPVASTVAATPPPGVPVGVQASGQTDVLNTLTRNQG